MPRRKRPTPPRMEIIVAKTHPPSGRYLINASVVRNRRESAGVFGCGISSAMLPTNVTDSAEAAHLPKGLFTSVAHGQAANQCWTSDYGGDRVLRHRRRGCTCRTASETSKPREEGFSRTRPPGRPAGSIGTFTLTALGRGEKRQIRRQRQRRASKCRPWIGRRGSLSMIAPQHGRWRV
jgi:hypothetical protein